MKVKRYTDKYISLQNLIVQRHNYIIVLDGRHVGFPGNVYKLTPNFTNTRWIWARLKGGRYYDVYDNVEDALISVPIKGLSVFSTKREFAEWLLERG